MPSKRERFLFHDTFVDGQNYIVYYSNSQDALVRINELELVKGLNKNNATYQQVVLDGESDTFKTVRQTTTEKTNLNLEEDLLSLLENKKYHVDMGGVVAGLGELINGGAYYDNFVRRRI